MVAAVDGEVKVAKVSVEGSKTTRLTCDGCDWMETAGSPSAATRKANKHVAEHRASTHGAPGVPTIMDAIEGEAEMPEGSFREPVPVARAIEDLKKGDFIFGRGRCGAYAEHDAPCRLLPGHMGEHKPHVMGEMEIGSISVVEEPLHPAWAIVSTEPVVAVGWSETKDGPIIETPVNTVPNPDAGLAHTPEEREKRFEHCPPHTRTVYEDEAGGTGPDYCHECSNEAQDWIAWPCPYIEERVPPTSVPPLAVALTRSRIETQAGPSDADKDDPASLWHEARAKAVSATLAAKLGSAADVEYIVAREVRERLNDARFRGNSYTRWGREREPYLEQVGLERYGIVGEDRLFHSRANPRHVCSPDGIAIHPEHGKVALGEYKTSGKELTLPKAKANGYIDQIQWQMYVMEAEWAVLIWEYRDGEKANYNTFRPFNGGEHIIMRDDDRIANLIRRADRFLEVLDAEQARMDEWTTRQVIPLEEQIDPHLQWLVHQHLEAKEAVRVAEEQLREYCDAEGVKSLEMPGDWKLSYSFGSPRKTFDKEAFEADNPGVYEKYLKEGAAPERATLRVTPAKPETDE